MTETIRVAVSGQLNCGKSTMFNAITGSTARVGNYPGITVDRLEGSCLMGDCAFRLVDLPSTYSLSAYSMGDMDADDAQSLSEKIAADSGWTMPGVIAIMVFMLLYAPCMVTVVVMIKESSWLWTLFAVLVPWHFPSFWPSVFIKWENCFTKKAIRVLAETSGWA